MNSHYIILISVLTALSSCNGQPSTQAINSKIQTENFEIGDTVSELSNNIMIIFQDKKSNYWFCSWQDGLYKYDGKTLIHYTTNDGLYSNRIDDIQEDKFGNIYLVGMNVGTEGRRDGGTEGRFRNKGTGEQGNRVTGNRGTGEQGNRGTG